MDATNSKIQDLREHRADMFGQINEANAEASKLKAELEKDTVEQREKIAEKNRVEREKNMARCVYNDTKNLIENERREFLERCREFRGSCRKIRAAASILVLDGGGENFDACDDEVDLWRKLQEDGAEEEEMSTYNARKREHKKIDSELDDAEKEEKKSRQNHIEAECGLETTRSEHENATKRCSTRRVKLTQQRAQLERHRKEVEELEREINKSKDEIVEANQLANTFEKGESTCVIDAPGSHTLLQLILTPVLVLSQNAKGGSKFVIPMCRLLTATISIQLHRNLAFPIHTAVTL